MPGCGSKPWRFDKTSVFPVTAISATSNRFARSRTSTSSGRPWLCARLGSSRRSREEPRSPSSAADLVALDGLLAVEPLDPRAQVALHGVYQHVAALLAGDAFARLLSATDHVERERWERDRTLLQVASKAREARFEAATRALGARRLPENVTLSGVCAFFDGRVALCASVCVRTGAISLTFDLEVGVVQDRAEQARRHAVQLLPCP